MKTLMLCAVIALIIPWGVYAGGKKAESKPLVSGQTLDVTGTIRLVGNMPFAELVITDAGNQDWYIHEESQRLFAGREGQTVTVRGTVELAEMILADSAAVGTRRILRRIQKIDTKK